MIYRKIILILMLFLFFSSCQKVNQAEKFQNENLCEILIEIWENDQRYRAIIQDPFFKILDSIRDSQEISLEEYAAYPKEQRLEYGRIAREIANQRKIEFTKKDRDSIMQLQIQLDNENTELLIKIIETRGLPNEQNSQCEKFPGHIFVHSQPMYWNKIKEIIDVEKANGNMDSGQYKIIMYHLEGRNLEILN